MLHARLHRYIPSSPILSFLPRLTATTDASDFLRKHPWPGRSLRDTFDDSTHRTKKYGKRFLTAMRVVCGKTGAEDDDGVDEYEEEEGQALWDASEAAAEGERPFYWTNALQQSFREELEK